MPNDTTRVMVTLTTAQVERLGRITDETGVSRSSVMSLALSDYLAKWEREHPQSAPQSATEPPVSVCAGEGDYKAMREAHKAMWEYPSRIEDCSEDELKRIQNPHDLIATWPIRRLLAAWETYPAWERDYRAQGKTDEAQICDACQAAVWDVLNEQYGISLDMSLFGIVRVEG